MFDKKEWMANYYQNVYKEKRKNTLIHCAFCNVDTTMNGIYGHRLTRRHKKNYELKKNIILANG